MVHLVHVFSAAIYRSPRDRQRLPQTNLALPRFTMIAFSTIVFLGFLRAAEGRQCDTYRDCLGDYINCCSGYCRRSCNRSCTRDEHCGSPGSLEEFCCKGKCISTSSFCEKPVADAESVLSSPVIAVVVIFSVMLVVAVCCFFRSHLCKLSALCFGESAQQVDISKVRGPGFVALDRGSVGTDDGSLNCTERISLQSTSTWVGQDFRIAPPKSSKIKRNGLV